MKAFVLSLMFGLIALLTVAGESSATYSRSLFELGSSVTVGDNLSADNMGSGICYKFAQYLNPSSPSSFYYGFLSGYFYHIAGGIDLVDTKYVTFGWRGLIAPWLGVDASISPVLGARIYENTVEGSAYMGVCPTIGFYVPVSSRIDLALSYEPVFNLYTFDGNTSTKNKTYSDIVFMVEFKSFSQVKKVTDDQAW